MKLILMGQSIVLLLLLPVPAVLASDDNTRLQLRPDKCVALRRGQTCFQRLRFFIEMPKPGEYCLRKEQEVEPIQCWNDTPSIKYAYQLESEKTVIFYLYHNQEIVAESTVTVAWVYNSKSRRRSSWRLF